MQSVSISLFAFPNTIALLWDDSSTEQYQVRNSTRSARGAQRREGKVVPLGVSVLSGYVVMPVRSPLSRWPLTAQLRSKSLGVFSLYSLCKQWTVFLFRALSLVVLLSVAMTRPICHCWCDSSAVCHLRHRPRTATSGVRCSSSTSRS